MVLACDPCFGVVGCVVPARVSVEGRLLDDSTGKGVQGAVIDFVRSGGVTLDMDSVRTVTDAEGFFRFATESHENGDVIGDVVVRLAQGGGYRARDMRFQTSNRRGEGHVLPPWSTVPRLPDLVAVYRRGYPRQFLANVEIEFRQTGGPAVDGLGANVFRAFTDAGGIASLFGGAVRPLDAGDVVGDLAIDAPAPLTTVHQGIRIPVRTTYRPAAALRLIGAGPSLDYYVVVMQRGRGGATGGVQLTFKRTDGIDISSTTGATDGAGFLVLPLRALDRGTVTGTLEVKPAAHWKSSTRTGVQLTTFEADSAILLDTLRIGPGLLYYVIVRNNGIPLKGVSVDFQQVSGVSVRPSRFTAVTDANGIADINPAPDLEGDVLADITVRSPAPHPAFTVKGVRLTAVDGDVPGGRTLIGDWNVASPPSSAVRVP
jgi:hypothetical protein